jgi:CheY-like chemotaxis protein
LNTSGNKAPIRVLVADDDAFILRCYQRAFARATGSSGDEAFDSLSDELFGRENGEAPRRTFDVVACTQGEDAVAELTDALEREKPFDVAILDVRMPPGINGVEAGRRIRELDPDIPVVFVTGYADLPKEELQRRLPPAAKLHYFSKPLSFSDLVDAVLRITNAAPAGEAP